MAEKHSPGKVDSQNLRSECTTSPLTYQLLLPPPQPPLPPPHYNNYSLTLLNWPHLQVTPYQDRSPKKNIRGYLKHILQARMPFLSPIQCKN